MMVSTEVASGPESSDFASWVGRGGGLRSSVDCAKALAVETAAAVLASRTSFDVLMRLQRLGVCPAALDRPNA